MYRRRRTRGRLSRRRVSPAIAMASSSRCRCCSGLFGGQKVEVFAAGQRPEVDRLTSTSTPATKRCCLQHAAHGCVSLWCATSERAYPFVFRPRLVRGFVPCAQLIYLPRRRRFRPLRRTDRPLPGAARQAVRHPRRQCSNTRACSAGSAAATCQNISKARSGRGSATSLTLNTRCSASRDRA